MARYIDSDKVIEVIVDTPSMVGSKYDFDHDVLTALVDKEHEIIDLINNNVPTADVAPVIHAHWIVDVRGSYGVRNCSNCGGYGNDTHTHYGRTHGDVDGFRIKPLPYCPHCGAKMDEVIE